LKCLIGNQMLSINRNVAMLDKCCIHPDTIFMFGLIEIFDAFGFDLENVHQSSKEISIVKVKLIRTNVGTVELV
jgi:hypothetical protein